ncbi:MAG: hypothetical protein JWN43_3899 [Gammaproteobacteria bacterium]|nr:hypothetical protein [Gammaproteobacteria bacterium]
MRETEAAKPLLSRPEQHLYGRLVRAFPGHVILAHVPLLRFLPMDPHATATEVQAITNRYKHIDADFVVCRPDFTALAVIELEDGANPADAQRERQRRMDRFLQAAGVKVLRVSAGDLPHEPAIKALVAALPLHVPSSQPVRRAS